MKIQIWDKHRDWIGGGTMPMISLHNALVCLGHDVWAVESFHPNVGDYEFIEWPEHINVGRIDDPDVFIYNCYWENCVPWGKENWLYVLYPKEGWDVSAYSRILTTSEYSKQAIHDMWGREADILVGGVYAEDWYPGKRKSRAILSCSRFFIEGDVETLEGHSKNQHVMIETFKRLDLPDWELWLAGSVLSDGDTRYLARCQELAVGDERIKFYPTVTKEKLRRLYSRARIFWHAMGYGRDDPAEVEHYGYVLLKAALSGLWVVSHNSGNLAFSHFAWDTPDKLGAITERLAGGDKAARTCAGYTCQDFIQQVEDYL